MRTAYGGFYTVEDIEATDEFAAGTTIEFVEHGSVEVPNPYGLEGYLDFSNEETVDKSLLAPNKRIPLRVYGDSEAISNDIFWKTLWIGGEFGDVTYSPIYNETVHSYYNVSYEFPYPQINANAFSGDDISRIIQISYDYSAYLPQYQNYIAELDSELLIPNYYIMFDIVYNENDLIDEGDASLYSNELISYVTAENSYPDIGDFFTFNPAAIPDGIELADYVSADTSLREEQYAMLQDIGGTKAFLARNSYLATEFLTSSYIQNPLSSSTQEWVKDRMKNLLFDEDAIADITDTRGPYVEYASQLPYKIKINFEEYRGYPGTFTDAITMPTGLFANSIRNNKFSSKFIKTLYKVFDNKIGELLPSSVPHVASLGYTSASVEDGSQSDITTAQTVTYRQIDYVNFLAHCYNNYISSDEGCLFVGGNTLARLSATDTTGIYRHLNTKSTLGSLTDVLEYLSDETNISIEGGEDIFTLQKNYTEPLAYRIEKIGGPPTGDSLTQNTIQNFWLFKPEELTPAPRTEDSSIAFYDSQVKYDTEYTYRVYVYVLTVGYRYKYSDLALTRNIGCEGAEGEYGLEFYNPNSADEETTPRIYEGGAGDNILVSDYDKTVSEVVDEKVYYTLDEARAAESLAQRIYPAEEGYVVEVSITDMPAGDIETPDVGGTLTGGLTLSADVRVWTITATKNTTVVGSAFASTAQIFSKSPYAADLYFTYEPSAKIIEIPLYEKTLKVLDSPTNKLSAVPYQVRGNSQKIGFDFVYTSFVENTFPSIISDNDQTYKEAYMHANDLLEGSYLVNESVSLQRYIEVYRLTERPTAMTDFEGSKIAEIDLAIKDLSQYSYKGAFYDDTIKTNQKYYYLFRVLSQQRNLSHLTEITEVELINDGGYKYAVFNILYEYELEQEVFNKATQKFKKLIQLQPNLSQLEFNTDNLDYTQDAASQIDNLIIGASEDSIWDKTFKVRLTSKKTSRKIDLNITYKLNSD